MRKVMIVDDELLVRVGLQALIKWEDYGFQIIGSYRNGQEAWEAIQQHPPDILLTDIRMPGMGGLELAEKVRSLDKNINIIVFSSFEEFEYLRKSIQIGIQDYIPKYKLNPEELIEIFNKLQYHDQDETHIESDERHTIDAEKVQLLVKTRYYSGIQASAASFQSDQFPLLMRYCQSEEGKQFSWFSLQSFPDGEIFTESHLRAFVVHVSEYLQRVKTTEFIGADGDILHGLMIANGDCLHDEMNTLAIELIDSIHRNLNMKVSAGVSHATNRFSALGELRTEAELSLMHSFYQGVGTCFFDSNPTLGEFDEKEWKQFQKTTRNYLLSHQYDSLCVWVEEEVSPLVQNKVRPQEAIRLCRMIFDLFMEQIRTYHSEYISLMNDELASMSIQEKLDMDDHIPTFDLLISTLTGMIRRRLNILRKLEKRSGWISAAIQYIHVYYDQPIRLEDVAGKVNFSVNYFSQRFHQEMGRTFSNYLMQYRIRKAVELLRSTHLSTEEVSDRVGYVNCNYFVKVFKKVTGRTITEYKKRQPSENME
ncbi:MAG: response regulator [Paenibacillaceae bacterium]